MIDLAPGQWVVETEHGARIVVDTTDGEDGGWWARIPGPDSVMRSSGDFQRQRLLGLALDASDWFGHRVIIGEPVHVHTGIRDFWTTSRVRRVRRATEEELLVGEGRFRLDLDDARALIEEHATEIERIVADLGWPVQGWSIRRGMSGRSDVISIVTGAEPLDGSPGLSRQLTEGRIANLTRIGCELILGWWDDRPRVLHAPMQPWPNPKGQLTVELLADAADNVEQHGKASFPGSERDAFAVAAAIRRFAPPQPQARPWGINVTVGHDNGLVLISRIDDPAEWGAVAAALRAWRPGEDQ